MQKLILLLLVEVYLSCNCVHSESGSEPSPLKRLPFLSLVPWRDVFGRKHAGWSAGPDLLAAGRVAVKEINTRADILPGYELHMIEGRHEACGLTEANIGISDLAKYGMSPPYRTVIAVLGLFCSTSAKEIAQLAGKADILQLSAANSPIFDQKKDKYPNLWRVLVSADAYAQMMVKLMKFSQWNSIGVVQDLETIFHSGIAEKFVYIAPQNNITIKYHSGLVEVNQVFVNKSLDEIKHKGVRIVFISATGPQTALLLCSAANRSMTYPDYLWIITDFLVSSLIGEAEGINGCNKVLLEKALNGSLILYFSLDASDDTVFVNGSGETYADYKRKYEQEVINTKAQYYDTGDEKGDVLYAGLLYDQVWALGLALNNIYTLNDSLVDFIEDISIDNYRLRQFELTKQLEDSLSKISFRGATGTIKFTDDREVETPIDIFQVDLSVDPPELLIGKYYFNNNSISIANTTLPSDAIRTEIIKLNIPVLIVLYTLTFADMILVSVVLIVFIYHRNRPQIKATSPWISTLIFIGCYCLCLVAFVRLLYSGTDMSDLMYAILCNSQTFLVFNGMSLIFVTIFIKLLRIRKIFKNKSLKYLSCLWSNYSLTTIVLVITIIPNVFVVLWIAIDPLERQVNIIPITTSPLLYMEKHYTCGVSNGTVLDIPLLGWYGFLFGYLAFFLLVIVILAAQTGNIKHGNFKDTKKVNAFIFLFVLTFSVTSLMLWMFTSIIYLRNIAHIVMIVGMLLMVLECQVMLFLPKLVTFARNHKRRHYTITEGIKSVLSISYN